MCLRVCVCVMDVAGVDLSCRVCVCVCLKGVCGWVEAAEAVVAGVVGLVCVCVGKWLNGRGV